MSRKRTATLLAAVVMTTSVAFAMVLTLVPLLADSVGTSPAVIGVLTASLSVLPMLLAVRTGALIDGLGPRTGMLASALLLTLAPLPVLLRPGVPALFVTEVLLGLANLLAVVAAQTYTATLGSAESHEGDFGWYATYVGAGQIAGPLLAGVLAQWYGYPAAFAAAAGVAAAGLALSAPLPDLRAPRRPEAATRRSGQVAGTFERALSLLSDDGVRLAVVFTFSIALAQSVFLSFFPVILQAAGMAAGLIGTLISVRALVSTVLRPFLPTLVGWLGNRRNALVAMVALLAAGSGGIGLHQSALMALLVSVVIGIGWGLAPPLSIVMVIAGAAETELGFALGVRFTVNRLAQLVGPLAIGAVAGVLSLQAGFLASGGLIAASLGYLRLPRAGRRARE